MEYTKDKQNFALKITDKNGVYELLAGNLDNDNHWIQLNNNEFVSNILPEIKLKIKQTKDEGIVHIYSIHSDSELYFEIIKIDTGEIISDTVKLNRLFNEISKCDDSKIISNNKLALNILGNKLIIKNIELISLLNKKSILQFEI